LLTSAFLVLALSFETKRSSKDRSLLKEIRQNNIKNFSHEKSSYLIQISHGSFGYSGESHLLFRDFSLTLEREKIYAISAPPMAGTSTLLKLLGQKLSFNHGLITHKAHMKVALLDDDAEIFEASLLENIRLFNNTLSESDVVYALEQACAEELFYERPLGLLAPLNNYGTNVSGGQKKRLLLARALIYKPDLLLLDDFFESLEPKLAQKILHNLKAFHCSVVFSTQRAQERALADSIISWSAS
jgi:ATP-binding cassette subfamily B protein